MAESFPKEYVCSPLFWDAHQRCVRFQKEIFCAILRLIFSFFDQDSHNVPVASVPHPYNRC